MTGPILLLGPHGQVGTELQRALAPLGPVVAWDRTQGGDLSDPQRLRDAVMTLRPRAIVNAAAYTAVDRAESEPELADVINAQAPAALAQAAQALGAWLLHYSTDYVFPGTGEQAWQEGDATAPLNVYGQTKRAGEQVIQAVCARHLVFRTSWVYGLVGSNFAKTMVRLATQRERLQVVADQVGAPTGAALIADVSAHALRQAMHNETLAGLYHLAAAQTCSWHAYAQYVIERAQQLRPDWTWAVQEIAPVDSAAFATAAKRPLNSRLDTRRLREAFGLDLPDWQVGVDQMLRAWLGVNAPER